MLVELIATWITTISGMNNAFANAQVLASNNLAALHIVQIIFRLTLAKYYVTKHSAVVQPSSRG